MILCLFYPSSPFSTSMAWTKANLISRNIPLEFIMLVSLLVFWSHNSHHLPAQKLLPDTLPKQREHYLFILVFKPSAVQSILSNPVHLLLFHPSSLMFTLFLDCPFPLICLLRVYVSSRSTSTLPNKIFQIHNFSFLRPHSTWIMPMMRQCIPLLVDGHTGLQEPHLTMVLCLFYRAIAQCSIQRHFMTAYWTGLVSLPSLSLLAINSFITC